jgi:hypothetical protein
LRQLLPHCGKRDVLRALNRAGQPARILLGEKAFGDDDVKIYVQRDRRERDKQNGLRVQQNPRQRPLIIPVNPLKSAFLHAFDGTDICPINHKSRRGTPSSRPASTYVVGAGRSVSGQLSAHCMKAEIHDVRKHTVRTGSGCSQHQVA